MFKLFPHYFLLTKLVTEAPKKQKTWKMIETLAHGYLSEIIQQELSNEYKHDRV